MEKKNNGGLVVIIIILLVALLGVSFYVVYDKGLLFNNNDETNVEENKESENIVEENKAESNYVSLEIKDENCINNQSENYGLSAYDNSISISLNDDNSVSMTYKQLNNLWYASNSSSDQVTVNVNNFSKRIIDMMIGGIGQDITGSTAIFLMEDGSLEYIPLYKALHSNNIKSYGKLEGVEGIVKLYSVTAQPKNSPIGGHVTVLAQKIDGTYYDLRPILQATGNY